MTTEVLQDAPVITERRQFHRRKFLGTIEIEWGSSTLIGVVRDIGPRGLFVQLTPPLWIGATFSARLMLNPPIPLDCRVARVEPGAGIALTFDFLDQRSSALLDELLKKLPKA